MSFDKIISEDFALKSSEISIKGSDRNEYKFTVNELSPVEMAYCIDEFNTINFLSLISRSVRDQDGKRMTLEQASKLPEEIKNNFIKAYFKLKPIEENKKKSKKLKKAKNSTAN